ncbi:MAG TPA: dTDP-4-dehydrorhamnose 3,5-epimerase [Chryseosolibacter sp.]|nr:dTDP-4-dehydrorhamnose 3,5-epimerase [Chryseosolibacter sp.]
MQIKQTGFEGLVELIPSIFYDERGWFLELYKDQPLKEAGIDMAFPQENLSFSKKGVIRGLHFQRPPYAQAKLAAVISGSVLDVVADLRKGSKTFGQTYVCKLDSQRKNMLLVPEGFAHGFAALEDSIFFYKCSNVFHKPSESGVVWNDRSLNIQWPVAEPIVSEKDRVLPTFEELLGNSVISRD